MYEEGGLGPRPRETIDRQILMHAPLAAIGAAAAAVGSLRVRREYEHQRHSLRHRDKAACTMHSQYHSPHIKHTHTHINKKYTKKYTWKLVCVPQITQC